MNMCSGAPPKGQRRRHNVKFPRELPGLSACLVTIVQLRHVLVSSRRPRVPISCFASWPELFRPTKSRLCVAGHTRLFARTRFEPNLLQQRSVRRARQEGTSIVSRNAPAGERWRVSKTLRPPKRDMCGRFILVERSLEKNIE